MKLNKNWHSNQSTHKPKRVVPKPKKIPFQLLGLAGPPEEKKSNLIDEVRRQAVLMSSRGFREALRSTPSTPSAKGKGRNEKQKPRRGATEKKSG
ncbi:MAG: hypothetical protein JSU59_09425 [Nitrospirota bacterium]|nr:MAG: hypothetical protein JSU59_09425 [Nitrospirota bacterium]